MGSIPIGVIPFKFPGNPIASGSGFPGFFRLVTTLDAWVFAQRLPRLPRAPNGRRYLAGNVPQRSWSNGLTTHPQHGSGMPLATRSDRATRLGV